MNNPVATASLIGRYRVLGELGRGAMGIVYEAADDLLGRPVAIKTINMSADLAERADHEARFLQEAKAAGGLSHPNVVTVYDVGRESDLLYMAMELLDGEELRDVLARGDLPLTAAIDIAAQVADGLAFAHERGVVHRDIKPSNIMVMRGGVVKIMDFGIARIRTSDIKTQTGLRLGSPRYMSPEQLLGQGIDRRADIFALGVVLYEMVAGIAPFGGDDVQEVMFRVASFDPPAPSRINPAVPTVLDLVVTRAIAKDPAKRYQDAQELAQDLRAAKSAAAAEARSPPPRPAAAVGPTTATRTLPVSRGDIGTETGPCLVISHRFDSTSALRALAAATGMSEALEASGAAASLAATSTEETHLPVRRAARSHRLTGPLVLAGVLGLAALAALAIAFG
jgi:eukaryotic-like serine/threonine-protein kinase